MSHPLLIVTATPGARGADGLAAGLGFAAASEQLPAIVAAAGQTVRPRRPTLLASPGAREAEAALGGPAAGAAARGLICSFAAGQGPEALDRVAELRTAVSRSTWVLQLDRDLWQPALEHPGLRAGGALIRAELPRDRALASLAVRDLRARGLRVRIPSRSLGWAAGRRALAGLRLGGADEVRVRRWARILLGAASDAGAQPEGGGGDAGGIAEIWLDSGGALPGRTTSN